MTVRVIQVTNISRDCQKEQIRSLFSNVGRIDDIQLYPDSETLSASVGAKVGYIKFDKSEVAQAALQLTNTVFIDKALICSLVKNGKIPDETEAVKFCAPLNPNITLIPGGLSWHNTIINRMVGTGISAIIETIDPALNERSLPQYPPLPGTTDPLKAEEIRRTVFVSNILSNVSLENLNDLFSQVGEVRFIRFAGDENASVKSAYIEFSEQPHIIKALCLNGLFFGGKHIKVNHATCSIIKPATSKQIFATREKTPKHSSSRKRSKSPSTNKSSKKRSSRSPRRRSSSLRKRSHSKKRSKSPHKRSSTSKKHSHDREKRRRSTSSKAKKRSRSKDRKRSKSKDVKKRRSTSRNRESSSNKSNKKSESSRQNSSSGYKSSRNRSRSRDKSSDIKKSKSKDYLPPLSPTNRKETKDKIKSPEVDRAMEVDSKLCLNGKSKAASPKAKEIKLYGPNPPPLIKNAFSSSDSSSSSNSSSSDDDDDDEDENPNAMDH